MALPNSEIEKSTLDFARNRSNDDVAHGSLQRCVAHCEARTHFLFLTTGGNPSSAAGSVPAQDDNAAQEVTLDYYLPLHRAAFKGNWEEARRFLDNDPSAVNARITNLSMTALHVAAIEGHSEFVEKLVKCMRPDALQTQDDIGFTPLHYAAIGGSLRSAKALLKENPNLAQSLDSTGRTPLLVAATFSESKELVWYLLMVTTNDEPGKPFSGSWGANLMNVLIASGFHEISLHLLEKYPNLATATDQEDWTPLHVLAMNKSNFLTGSRLGFWESCIYPFLPVQVDYRPPYSVRPNMARHESARNLQDRVLQYWLRRMLCGAIKLIAPACFTRLQDAKLGHHYAVELVKQICSELERIPISSRLNYLSDILKFATINGITEKSEIVTTLLEAFPDLLYMVRLSRNQ